MKDLSHISEGLADPGEDPPPRVSQARGQGEKGAGMGLALMPTVSGDGDDRPPRQGDDERDAASVYRQHGARVSRWAARLAGPGHDVDDIVHDVFLVVLRRLPGFRGDAQIATWLHEITVRVVQTHRRKRRRRAWLWPFAALRTPEGEGPDPADHGLTPLESLERRQATALLYRFLDGLDDKYRTAVILFELEEVPCREIAALTGTSLANVWARVSRGREQLIQAFARWEARGRT